MSVDKTSKEPSAPKPEWKLPTIVDISIRSISYQAPKLRFFQSQFAKYNKAVEFLVKTNDPIPIRALSPALYVDDTEIIEGETVEKNLTRFLAFDIDKLQQGAPILFGWQGDPK